MKDCYAMQFYLMYLSVRRAWQHNSFIANNHIGKWIDDHNEYIVKNKCTHFRFFVGGDIISKLMWEGIKYIAKNNPTCNILLFTKAFVYIYDSYKNIPSNLHVRLSVFNIKDIPDNINLPIALTINHKEDLPDGYILCNGSCVGCMLCFNTNRNVAFVKH